MSTWELIIIALAALAAAPVAGAALAGVDRRVTARMQGRQGPPLLQPFYDTIKLLAKSPLVVNRWQPFCAINYLLASAGSLVLFVTGGDLLAIFFLSTVGSTFLVIGALAAPSPYSQVGAQRELMQVLTYEPLLILAYASFYLVTGSFEVGAVWRHGQPLLLKLPLVYLMLGYMLTIKLRKSPLDISTSHHAHQEIVKGVLTEYSGPYLALIEIGHWYEIVLVLMIYALFWSTSWVGMAVLLAATYFIEIVLDNVLPRLTWRWMVRYVWGGGLVMAFANLAYLHFFAR